jgi:hypothetical protein
MMRPIHLRLSALCLPLFFGGEHFVPFVTKARMRMHRENEIAFLSAPAIAGEGDHWSSRSERTVVEGAPDSELRCRCRKFSSREEASEKCLGIAEMFVKR